MIENVHQILLLLRFQFKFVLMLFHQALFERYFLILVVLVNLYSGVPAFQVDVCAVAARSNAPDPAALFDWGGRLRSDQIAAQALARAVATSCSP